MTKFSEKYNKGKLFTINTTGFPYKSLPELYSKNGKDFVYPLRGVYINTKGKFDDSPVFVTDKYFVNVPVHMMDTVNEILEDRESIDQINNGEVGFTIYPYMNTKYNRECYSVDFVDIQ